MRQAQPSAVVRCLLVWLLVAVRLGGKCVCCDDQSEVGVYVRAHVERELGEVNAAVRADVRLCERVGEPRRKLRSIELHCYANLHASRRDCGWHLY